MSAITNITLVNDEPVAITVVLTTAEAAAIAKWAGSLTPNTAETSSLYLCLMSGLFNRFYEDGVDGYLAGDQSS